jgi:soluble lytic murein transglycosylase-like protein
MMLVGGALFLAQATQAAGADKIQAFIGSKGKVVFTNLVENPPSNVPNGYEPPAEVRSVETRTDGIPATLNSLVIAISQRHGVDPALVRAVMKTESAYNRWAVSAKGAMGLMQLIPGTGRRFGVQDFFDPSQNIEGGVRYLKFLLQKFNGNLDLSLAAYNAGENLVQRLGKIPSIPETKNYVRKVRSIYNSKSMPLSGSATPTGDDASSSAEEKETPRIFRTIDDRGVVHFSNIEPPN